MKVYDITKLTAELKSSDNVQYRNKIITLLVVLVDVATGSKRITYGKSNLPYEDCCKGVCKLPFGVRFVNSKNC